ncbi:hypothetical protein ADL22_09285 [Streptomyces sp. NRRL F-4489]|nr:hypothetical protein ADL22_09285 [Streptomyces sp. NRRL F-4489]
MPRTRHVSRARNAARVRRLAACTALVLSAGMLLSAPASADDRPAAPDRRITHHTADDRPSVPTLPPRTAKRPGNTGTGGAGKGLTGPGVAAAPGKAAPRFDLDGDGWGDILYRAQDGGVRVIPSDNTPVHRFALEGAGGEMFKDLVPLGDQDGNGTVELLTLSSDGTLTMRSDAGLNGTTAPLWSGKGWQIYNKLVAPGDLTGDGKTDLLARTPSGELYLYRSNGRVVAPFATRVKVGGGWQIYDQIVGVNDANGDGLGDLYARTPTGDLYFYAGTGDASAPFKPRVQVGYGYGIYNQLLSADDFDGDGYADLLARTPAGEMYVYRSNGTGQLLARTGWGSGWGVVTLFAGAGANPHLGKSELLALDTSGTLYFYYSRNNGKVSPRAQASNPGAFAGARLIHPSSMDNNGQADVFQIYRGGLYNYEVGSSSGPYLIGGGWDIYNTVFGPGDLNGDGKGDLLARDGSGNLYLYRGDGTGQRVASRIKVGGGWNAYDALVGAGDITGDGLADIVARTPGGTLYLYAGTGVADAPFKARVSLGGGWNTYRKLAAPGDINGDGRASLLGVDSRGDLYAYYTDGKGSFRSRVKIGNGWNIYSTLA